MGLGGLKSAWQRQTKDFAHTHSDKYTSLVFDNRGIGESDKPYMRYSTSEMALDVVELLHHVGWTSPRDLHVVGISMGGMIAQELVRYMSLPRAFTFKIKIKIKSKTFLPLTLPQAIRIPDRIASLSLVSTAPYLFNTVVCRLPLPEQSAV